MRCDVVLTVSNDPMIQSYHPQEQEVYVVLTVHNLSMALIEVDAAAADRPKQLQASKMQDINKPTHAQTATAYCILSASLL